MKKVVCVACGLVNLDTFPSFPACAACGARLPSLRRPAWRERLRRPVLPLVWALILGACVGMVALLSVAIARDTQFQDRGSLVVEGQSAPDPLDARVQLWTLSLQPADAQDTDPLRHVRLRLSVADEKLWSVSVVSPTPQTRESLGQGRYFGWSQLRPGTTVRLRLVPPVGARPPVAPLRLLWAVEGFEALSLSARLEPPDRSH